MDTGQAFELTAETANAEPVATQDPAELQWVCPTCAAAVGRPCRDLRQHPMHGRVLESTHVHRALELRYSRGWRRYTPQEQAANWLAVYGPEGLFDLMEREEELEDEPPE
jgi:hypothetical protein